MHAYACNARICMHAYAYVCICMHAYGYACICMHMHAFACICLHMHAFACMCMHVPACACMCIHVPAYARMCLRVLACACMCMHMHAYAFDVMVDSTLWVHLACRVPWPSPWFLLMAMSMVYLDVCPCSQSWSFGVVVRGTDE